MPEGNFKPAPSMKSHNRQRLDMKCRKYIKLLFISALSFQTILFMSTLDNDFGW
jgi:hypothetical protein